jgi:hypothetical protein
MGRYSVSPLVIAGNIYSVVLRMLRATAYFDQPGGMLCEGR